MLMLTLGISTVFDWQDYIIPHAPHFACIPVHDVYNGTLRQRIIPPTWQQTTKCSCSSALHHKHSGCAAYRL